ncbi:hypothetical protein L2E82_42243 [Cichorium intybus]|uniref:Uncharacterized protein n=1 Tax=Cichorium intybus TaxID=13427 RepID=A0ACB8ZLW9_CICIN|nr:hypothetical protein L2E82_42243 [Cichorium intybus]
MGPVLAVKKNLGIRGKSLLVLYVCMINITWHHVMPYLLFFPRYRTAGSPKAEGKKEKKKTRRGQNPIEREAAAACVCAER